MAGTPEGKIKKMVRDVLAEFVEYDTGMDVAKIKQYWPVPSGFGASDLDCIVCYYGQYIAIETKAPGKKPTPRQKLTIAETRGAGGAVFVIDGEQGCFELRVALQRIKDANYSKREA
jgi:hypothetical protein